MSATFAALTRRLPRGPVDAARQVALFAIVYSLYSVTRGMVDDSHGATIAFANGRRIIHLERSTGLFFEHAVQTWTSRSPLAIHAADWIYINAQTTIAATVLVFIYLAHNDRYDRVRNMVIIAMAIALVGYLVYPTAPPRFFPEWGFEDSVAQYTGIDPKDVKVNALFNPYAAMPSMHVCTALLLGGALATMPSRRPRLRALWWLYPVVMSWAVVATANHWTLDLLVGALTAGASFAIAGRLAAHARRGTPPAAGDPLS